MSKIIIAIMTIFALISFACNGEETIPTPPATDSGLPPTTDGLSAPTPDSEPAPDSELAPCKIDSSLITVTWKNQLLVITDISPAKSGSVEPGAKVWASMQMSNGQYAVIGTVYADQYGHFQTITTLTSGISNDYVYLSVQGDNCTADDVQLFFKAQ